MRVVFDLKKDTETQVILNQLYKNTQMEISFGISMLALDHQQPKVMNLRVVVDVTDSPFDNSVIEALQRLADHDRPWVLVSATVGLTPIRTITNRLIAMKSHRKFGRFKDLGRALDWVAQQEGPPEEFPDEAD